MLRYDHTCQRARIAPFSISPLSRRVDGRACDQSLERSQCRWQNFIGEQWAKIVQCLVMARRPDIRQDDVLTREELKELQRRLSNLSVASVEEFYRRAHHRCSLQPRRLSSPRVMQELVQAWKLLRKWRR
jgi:hypothetical protein